IAPGAKENREEARSNMRYSHGNQPFRSKGSNRQSFPPIPIQVVLHQKHGSSEKGLSNLAVNVGQAEITVRWMDGVGTFFSSAFFGGAGLVLLAPNGFSGLKC